MKLVAWGFRNPFGLAFAPNGKLYVTDNGYDDRGSRPVWGTGDPMFEVHTGTWYGWPDFASGIRLDDPYWGEGGHGRGVPLKSTHQAAGVGVPEFEDLLTAGSDDVLAVGSPVGPGDC